MDVKFLQLVDTLIIGERVDGFFFKSLRLPENAPIMTDANTISLLLNCSSNSDLLWGCLSVLIKNRPFICPLIIALRLIAYLISFNFIFSTDAFVIIPL